jgi:nitronate monooxygenase
VDVGTVQGREAGGHVRGDTPLLPLLTSALEWTGTLVS